MEIIVPAICGLLGILVTKIFDLISERKKIKEDGKKELKEIREELKNLKYQLKIQEKDSLRTQLMVMIKDFPDETSDILRLAEYYFTTLGGNWVLTDIFSTWALENNVTTPTWFIKKESKND